MLFDEMKETGRRRSKQSGAVLKKKKKFTDSSSSSSSRNLSRSSKEKKRRRVVESDSESSDYSPEKKTTRHKRLAAVHKGTYLENIELETEKKTSSGLDVFEFDEYDGKDHKWRSWSSYRQTGLLLEPGNGGNRPTTSDSTMEDDDVDDDDDDDDDEFDLPLSVFSKKNRSSSSNKPIRLQGKNGVLKVMVNENKHMDTSNGQKQHKKKFLENGDTRDGHSPRTEDAQAQSKEKKGGLKSLKPMVEKSSKEVNESDHTPLQSKSNSRVEVVKKTDKVEKVKEKESSVKHGSGTEKQILREKIKNMLLGAGWTIDHRPRKNKNYLDAIYTSPAGTAYWSIIKAYEVLQKEQEDNDEDTGNFTPLPVEILGKFARQTQKKTAREFKTKRKDEGSSRNAKRAMKDTDSDFEEKLNSHGRKSRKLGRSTLLVRDSNTVLENDGFSPYSGKRNILAWLIDSGVVNMSEHVEYMNDRRTRILQKGRITRDGIRCGCCSKIVTVMKFEQHARSKYGQPFVNMFLESGKSLVQCQIDAWNKQGDLERKGFYCVDVDGDDPNDDTCSVCGDGGDLICCDGCPSTFHQSCLDIEMLPEGDWLCPNCSCKYCEMAGGNCTKDGGKTEAALLTCRLCYKKYHESCRPGIDVKPSEPNSLNLSFCGEKCHEVYIPLQKLVGVKHELDSGFSWSLIHRSDSLTDGSSGEVSHRVECNSMLAVSMSVMDECFLPFTDRRTGINLIRNVVFNCGSNLSRLNYSGFYTAILERGDELVAAASIRLHGTQLAEMPFIGTRHIYRRQGMCRRLLSAIESALSALQVDKLIIPAVAEHMNTWTDVFGFQPLKESHRQELKSMNMLVFPGTDMLQKPILKQGILDPILEVDKNNAKVDDGSTLSKKLELNSSNVAEFCEKTAITDSGSQEFGVPLDDGCSLDATKESLPVNPPVKDESPCKAELQLPVKESDSIRSHSDSKVNEIDVQNGNGTKSKEGSWRREVNTKEKELGAVSDSKAANNLSNNTVEVDDCNEFSTKPESISFNVTELGDKTATKDSGCQERDVPLDDGCHLDASKKTLPVNSPVKDESPCDPALPLPVKESDSTHSHSDSKVKGIAENKGNGTNQKEVSCGSEMNRREKERGILGAVSDSEAANDLSWLHSCNNTMEADDCSLLSKKQELISSNESEFSDKTATMDSNSQERSVPLDDGCSLDASKETLPINSTVKDESPCGPELQLPRKESDSIHSHSDSKVDEIDVQDPSHDSIPSIIPCEPQEVPASPSTEPKFQQPGKESDSIYSHSDSKVDEIDVQDPSHDSIPSIIPCEPQEVPASPSTGPKFQQPGKESDSIHSHSEPKVDGSDVPAQIHDPSHVAIPSDIPVEQVPAARSSEPELQLPGKESHSIHSHSDSKVNEIHGENGHKSNPFPARVHDTSHDATPFGIPCKSLEQVPSAAPTSEPKLQQPGKEFDSIHLHSNSKFDEIAMQNGQGNPGKTVKDNIQFFEGKEGSCENEMNSNVEERGISGAVFDSEAGNDLNGLHSDVSSNAEIEQMENPSTERV